MTKSPGRYAGKLPRGFTLVELMVTLSIVAILGLLAAPSLRSIFVKNGMNNVGAQFTGNLMRARGEAVNRNACTVMCISTNTGDAVTAGQDGKVTGGPACAGAGSDWQTGWAVFFMESCPAPKDLVAGTRPASPADYIAVQAPLSSDYKLVASGNTATSFFIFDALGRPKGRTSSAEFDLYFQTADSSFSQQYGYNVCVDALGRTRTVSGSQRC